MEQLTRCSGGSTAVSSAVVVDSVSGVDLGGGLLGWLTVVVTPATEEAQG
jgi:hypothetical protein